MKTSQLENKENVSMSEPFRMLHLKPIVDLQFASEGRYAWFDLQRNNFDVLFAISFMARTTSSTRPMSRYPSSSPYSTGE